MTDETALDKVHALMMGDLEDDAARLSFYGTLADTELFILLSEEAGSESIQPEILELDDTFYTLAFDSEERLTEFTKATAPYAALPGRALAAMLAGQKIGIGLNLGVAPSSILVPSEAMGWLQEALASNPKPRSQTIGAIKPLSGPATSLFPILTDKLHFAGSQVSAAFLASAPDNDGQNTLLLGFIDAPEAAHSALARAAQEAVVFSGLEDQVLNVVFLAQGSHTAKELTKTGTEIHLPVPVPATEPEAAQPPGSDPDKPPILK